MTDKTELIIELPREKKISNTTGEPTRLFLFSHPKVGKTSNLSALPNSLIIDLESGASHYHNSSIDVKKLAISSGKSILSVLSEILKKLKEEASEGKLYDFIIIDTTTALEEIAREYATTLYKESSIGKKFDGKDVVSELAQGAGYEWLRKAFKKIYNQFQGLSNKCLILSGHVKLSSIQKEGNDITARDIQLTGKLKSIVCQDADCIGYLYRKGDTNQNIITFKTMETDLATGSRIPELSGKEIIISEKINGEIVTYWDRIFPSLKSNKS